MVGSVGDVEILHHGRKGINNVDQVMAKAILGA